MGTKLPDLFKLPHLRWVPTAYLTDYAVEPRGSPKDWLVPLPDGRHALAATERAGDPFALGIVLTDEDRLPFRRVIDFGVATLTVSLDGTWKVTGDMPPPLLGATMLVSLLYDPETECPSVSEIISNGYCEPGTVAMIRYFAVADLCTIFRYDGASGALVPQDDPSASHASWLGF